MRVNGLFGWVRLNDARSAAFLVGFALLTQLMAAVALFGPLLRLDPGHAPWYDWTGYAVRYAPVVALGAALYFLARMAHEVDAVRKELAFRFVDRSREPRLCGLVEPLAIALGLEAPLVGLMEVPALNAFACGATRRRSVVVFTRGLVDGLDDDELSAVIAHELIRIRNGDTRLVAAANVFLRSLVWLDRMNIIRPKRYRQVATILLAPAIFPVYVGIALVSRLLVRLGHASRLLISSARQFVADSEAVRSTQDPAALLSALKRIRGRSALKELAPEHDAMLIDGATQGALATHPSLDERIQAIVAATGSLALEERPRRDTRPEYLRERSAMRGVVPETPPPNRLRRLARVAVTREAPRQNLVAAAMRVGEDGQLSLLGLRWDIAAAMLATFCVAVVVNHGNLLGLFSAMSHAMDRPSEAAQYFLDKARNCRNAELKSLFGGKPASGACDVDAEFASHAGALGFHLLPDGRLLTAAQMAMLSPHELERGGFATQNGMFSRIENGGIVRERSVVPPATEVGETYPLPLHEAWTRLVDGDLRRFLESQQCGVLIHAHVSSEPDLSVTWRITSQGEERIRFTATLAADGPDATRVALAITDRQPATMVYDSRDMSAPPNRLVNRPALATPLRPAFAEALNAMLEGRLFDIHNVRIGPAGSNDWFSGSKCANQRDAFERSRTPLSIHDPETSL